MEERAGVRSTFLVQVTSHYYNVAAPAARALLQDLVLRGFEVGLHFDPTVAGDSEAAWAERCAAERAFLERLAGAPLRSVSLHMPGAHGRYPLFEDVVNAYDPRWFGPDRYLSDSLRVWRHDPYAFVEQAAARGLTSQVLTHPIHYGEKAASYVELMGGVCVRWCTEACEYAARHNATYRRERESGGR